MTRLFSPPGLKSILEVARIVSRRGTFGEAILLGDIASGMAQKACLCGDTKAMAAYPQEALIASRVRMNLHVDFKRAGVFRYRAEFNPAWVQPLDHCSLALGRYQVNGKNAYVHMHSSVANLPSCVGQMYARN